MIPQLPAGLFAKSLLNRAREQNKVVDVVSRVSTVAFQGIEVLDIDVQEQSRGGLPNFTLVGLPGKAAGRWWPAPTPMSPTRPTCSR